MKRNIIRNYNYINRYEYSWYHDFGKPIKTGSNKNKRFSDTTLKGHWCVDKNDPDYNIYCSCCHTHFSSTMIGYNESDTLVTPQLTHCPICKCTILPSTINLSVSYSKKGKTQQRYIYEELRSNSRQYWDYLASIEISKKNHDINEKVFNLLEWDNRENWYRDIVPFITEVDYEDRQSNLSIPGGVSDSNSVYRFDNDIEFASFNDNNWFNFVPEELDINYEWKFKVGDIVTDGEDIMVIRYLPEIHPSNKDYNKFRVTYNGNTYWIIRLDKNGNCKDIEDEVCYLHTFYTENKLEKVDEQTSKYWKEKIKGKNFCCGFSF